MMSSSAVTRHGSAVVKRGSVPNGRPLHSHFRRSPASANALLKQNPTSPSSEKPSPEQKPKPFLDIPSGKIQAASASSDNRIYKVAEYKDPSLARGLTRPGGVSPQGLSSFLNQYAKEGWHLDRFIPQMRAFSPRTTIVAVMSKKA